MQAAEIAGVHRFLMISMLFAEDRNRWADPLKPYVAKFYADNWLSTRRTWITPSCSRAHCPFIRGLAKLRATRWRSAVCPEKTLRLLSGGKPPDNWQDRAVIAG